MGLLRSRELCYGYHGKMLRAYFEMRHPTSVQINKSPGGGGGGGAFDCLGVRGVVGVCANRKRKFTKLLTLLNPSSHFHHKALFFLWYLQKV